MARKTSPAIEILSQGEEIITGQTVDTNAAWLSQQLFEMGFSITRHTAVGDRLHDLISLVQEISTRADCCICTGGLGPTQDDLTAEAVAKAFDRPLQFDSSALVEIDQYFSRMGRDMPEVNRKQAMIPKGAKKLKNSWGTAPGFSFKQDRCWFACVPGVPYEMRNFFHNQIKQELLNRFKPNPRRLVTLRTVGIGESGIQQKLSGLDLPEDVVLGFRTCSLENQIKLLFPPQFSETNLREFVKKIETAIGKRVFSIAGLDGAGGSLVDTIGLYLSSENLSLAVLETVSGGRIARRCADKDWFTESWIVREGSNIANRYGVTPRDQINQTNLEKLVPRLANRAREQSRQDIVLLQLWCQNWDALEDETRTIRLYNGLATPDGCFIDTRVAGGPAPRKRTIAATVALDTLRRYLQNLL